MKLDIGCGPNKREGFEGVDQHAFPGVDHVFRVGATIWPFADNSVEEIHTSHFLEHLTAEERVNFVNQAFRVLVPGGKVTIIVPHWASNRAYGDPTHQWPPVSEMWFFYLAKSWRNTQAPHTDKQWNPSGFDCDFAATWGYSYSNELASRHPEHVQYALQNYKDAVQDLHATLVKPQA